MLRIERDFNNETIHKECDEAIKQIRAYREIIVHESMINGICTQLQSAIKDILISQGIYENRVNKNEFEESNDGAIEFKDNSKEEQVDVHSDREHESNMHMDKIEKPDESKRNSNNKNTNKIKKKNKKNNNGRYCPEYRSGAWGVLYALVDEYCTRNDIDLSKDLELADQVTLRRRFREMSKRQIIRRAQDHCDTSYTLGKRFNAWSGVKTLVDNGLVTRRLRGHYHESAVKLTPKGWDLGKHVVRRTKYPHLYNKNNTNVNKKQMDERKVKSDDVEKPMNQLNQVTQLNQADQECENSLNCKQEIEWKNKHYRLKLLINSNCQIDGSLDKINCYYQSMQLPNGIDYLWTLEQTQNKNEKIVLNLIMVNYTNMNENINDNIGITRKICLIDDSANEDSLDLEMDIVDITIKNDFLVYSTDDQDDDVAVLSSITQMLYSLLEIDVEKEIHFSNSILYLDKFIANVKERQKSSQNSGNVFLKMLKEIDGVDDQIVSDIFASIQGK